MKSPIVLALCLAAMVIIIVGVDVLFFSGASHFWPRLIVNVGIVLVFIAFYIRFFA